MAVAAHNVPREALIARLEDEPRLWVRLAAVLSESVWSLRLLELTVGERPPGWTVRRWAYPEAIFVASTWSGAQVTRWLRTGRARVLGRSLSLSDVATTASVERQESQWTGGDGHAPLRWPSEEWQLARVSSGAQSPFGLLVGDDSPSFVSFDTAAASLLGLDITGWRAGREFVVRSQDDRGRVRRVFIRPAAIEVEVEGRALRGAVVELAGNQPGTAKRLATNHRRTVRLPLPSGLPDGAWVVLRRESEWLDRRFLAWPHAQQLPAGVEVEIQPSTRLDALVAGGEGLTTEFKEHSPGDDERSKRTVMKTVAAFANAGGGSIVFGVSDDGRISGLSEAESKPDARDRLTSLVRTWIAPLPRFTVEAAPLLRSQRTCVILSVDRGDQPPYAAGTHATNYVYYVRRGATSFPVGPEEVRALAHARDSTQTGVLRRRID